jgi:hypothetical protein
VASCLPHLKKCGRQCQAGGGTAAGRHRMGRGRHGRHHKAARLASQPRSPPAAGAQLLTMSVRSCTNLQLRGNAQAQLEARTRYASSALREGLEATGEEAGAEAQTGLRRSMARLWKLEWDNRPKEALWRLMVNGVRGAGGHDVTPAGACPCGWHPPAPAGAAGGEAPVLAWRKHAFWHCPVAAAVRREIHSGLGRAPSCANTWLLQPPRKTMHARVWGVGGMVAVAAMEHGRKAMWVMHKERSTGLLCPRTASCNTASIMEGYRTFPGPQPTPARHNWDVRCRTSPGERRTR